MNEHKKLPKDWEWVKFEDFLDYIQPNPYIVNSTEYNDEYKIPVLTAGKSFILGYTNEKEGIFSNLPVIIFDDFTTANKFVNFKFKVKSSAMKILKPKNKEVNILFVYYYMQTVRITFDTHKRYWISIFSKLPIPNPPLPIQEAIVSKIEELFSELDKGIENLKNAQAQLKTYRQSVLKWAFEGKLTNENIKDGELPEGWKWVKLGDVIIKLDQGWSPKCENQASTNDDEWAVIKTSAIQYGYFLDFENKRIPINLEIKEQHELKKGDLLITRAGPRIRVGVCCLVRKVRKRLINCDKVYRINIDNKEIIAEYLESLLNSPTYQEEIENTKSGISDSGLNLTQRIFLLMQIPLPPLTEQHIIIQEIESRLSVADKLQDGITQSLQQAESLRQSILKKAFEGELV